MQTRLGQDHKRVAFVCVLTALVMAGLAYAAVPLYQIFCQATGLGGTPQKAQRPSDIVLDRMMTVRFDANVSPQLAWKFEPLQQSIDIRIGESTLVFYRATNLSNHPIKATATFNVTPEAAGIHFKKIECFCFTEQILDPGQSTEFPVSFYIDPALVHDPDSARLKEIILSYTFYSVHGGDSSQKQVRSGTQLDKSG